MTKSSSKKPATKAKSTPKKSPVTSRQSDFTELRSLQEIKNLIEFAAEKQFEEIELERGDFRLCLRKGGTRNSAAETPVQVTLPPQMLATPVPAPMVAPVVAAPVAPEAVAASAAPPAAAPEENLHIITSPIVGTFYRSSSPTTNPFIKIGDSIESGQTLCIVEAMKLMNEIQSDVSGTVVKILVENAQPVEYGQPLFGIKL